MPTVTFGTQQSDVAAGTRLVPALEAMGINIGHRCGGNARCTTCRVHFAEGEPAVMTAAEHAKLAEKGLSGSYRLACQICVDADMVIDEIPMTLESQGWTDTGPALGNTITPDAERLPIAAFTS
jgi:ferredoxin